MIRQEIYAVDDKGEVDGDPYSITQMSYGIKKLQESNDGNDASFLMYQSETLTYTYDKVISDPLIKHHMVVETDKFGHVLKECEVAYARRDVGSIHPLQDKDYISITESQFINSEAIDQYQIGLLCERKRYEINRISRASQKIVDYNIVKSSFSVWVHNALHNNLPLPESNPTVAKLIDWHRTHYWNDSLSDILPFGQMGVHGIAHSDEVACFHELMIPDVYDTKVSNVMLTNSDEGNYFNRDSYWWQRSAINHHKGITGFYKLHRLEDSKGENQEFIYDDFHLAIIESRDALGNVQKSKIDYNLLRPYALIDANDNESQVQYDALGMIVVETYLGSVLDSGAVQKYGNELLDTYTIQEDNGFDDVLLNPQDYLQSSSSFLYYDFSSTPMRMVRLTRTENVNDGKGNINNSSDIQISIDYQDGFGRIIQSKSKVESGPVLQFNPDGTIISDLNGEPVMINSIDRWLVDGHIIYNNKQYPVRKYQPYFTSDHLFDDNSNLEKFGEFVEEYYDPLGRKYKTAFPNGTFAESKFGPWELQQFDQNDTVDRSLFKMFNEVFPNGSLEKQSLDKSLAHKDTPTVFKFDPLGREIVKIDTNNNGKDRKSTFEYDFKGHMIQVKDSRDLLAFEYKSDMIGRLLYENSMDSGEKWFSMIHAIWIDIFGTVEQYIWISNMML